MTPDLKARLRDLASFVIGDRPDRHLLLPGLACSLHTAVQDWIRCYGDPSLAEATVKDHAILLKSPVARRTKKKEKELSRVVGIPETAHGDLPRPPTR